MPGAPDLALRRYRAAVFVQGCFWHGHSCRKGRHRPSANREYWAAKLDGNIARDARNHAELRRLGWRVFVIWECRLREDTEALVGWLKDMKSEFR